MKLLSLLLIAVLFTGCGPFVSGTWSDDPKNWKRAFGEERPSEGIMVVRSWYMRTPHFTAEFAWFFQLELSAKAKKELVSSPALVKSKLTPEEALRRVYQPRPAWFLPELSSAFEVFESKESSDFLVFVEKAGSRSFWTALQL